MASKSTRDTGTFSFTVEPLELKNLFSLLSALPKEVQGEVRDQANMMSKRLAGQLIQFGLVSPTPQAKLVVQSIQVYKLSTKNCENSWQQKFAEITTSQNT